MRNNFPRIQTAISDIRGLLDNLSSVNQAAAVIEQGLIDACKQFSRQLQSTQVSSSLEMNITKHGESFVIQIIKINFKIWKFPVHRDETDCSYMSWVTRKPRL